ncbi:porin [Pseudoduganella sp. LjRoot289]|uniref:porin n=1 Tax=Pseudoduganella sp. LjRoot289 TaxID=3342314 RepID=UPI003ECE9782
MRFAHPALRLLAAIAAAFTALPAPAQVSNVQIYGIVDMYAGRSATSGVPARLNVVNSGGMTTSYWGIGGVESLGDGRSATFALEGFMRVDTGESGRTPGDPLLTRAAYVGLNDTWGAAKAGRVPNPLFQLSAGFNPYGFSTRFSPLMTQMWIVPYGSSSAGDSGWSNALHYTSPVVGGFNVVGQYGLGEHAANSPGDNKVAVLKYSSATLSGAVAAQEIGNGIGITNASPKQRTVFAGTAYDFKVAKAYATYARNKTDGSGRDTRTFHLGLAVPHGAGKWLLAWARADERASVKAPFRRNTAAAGYDYNMSVRTDLYAVYLYDKLSTARSGNTYALGIRHKY